MGPRAVAAAPSRAPEDSEQRRAPGREDLARRKASGRAGAAAGRPHRRGEARTADPCLAATVPRGAACPGGGPRRCPCRLPSRHNLPATSSSRCPLPAPLGRAAPSSPPSPRQLRGKGLQPHPGPSRGPPCPRRAHGDTLPPPPAVGAGASGEVLPGPEFDVKHVDTETSSHWNSWAAGSSHGDPTARTPSRSPCPDPVSPLSGQRPPRRHREMPRVMAHGIAVPREKVVGNPVDPAPPAGTPRVITAPGMAPSLDPPSVPWGPVLPRPPPPAWGANAAAASSPLRPQLLGNENAASRRAGSPPASGRAGGRQGRGDTGSARVSSGPPGTGLRFREFGPRVVPAPCSHRWRESFSLPPGE